MRTKKDIIFSISAIVLGIIPFVILAIIALTDFASLGNENLGIIGGVDGPTAALRVQWALNNFIRDNPVFACFLYIALPLILSGAFYLIFTKIVKQNCTLKTSAVALGISAAGGLGLYCFFSLAIIDAFNSVGESPILFPVARIFGVLSLITFIGLIVLYVLLRKKKMSIKGMVLDVIISVIFLPSFFCIFACAHQVLSDLIRSFQ